MTERNYTTEQIKEKVSQILLENYLDTPPVDMVKLLDNYGVPVHKRHFPLKYVSVSGFITFVGGNVDTPIFVTNAKDSDERQNFTLAHEFGHWMLHREALADDPSLGVLYKSPIGVKTSDSMEIEANEFAAQLLVPDAMLQADHEDTSTHLDKKTLANKFKVGEDIIGFRFNQNNPDDVSETVATEE